MCLFVRLCVGAANIGVVEVVPLGEYFCKENHTPVYAVHTDRDEYVYTRHLDELGRCVLPLA
jgi:hypothetical protein